METFYKWRMQEKDKRGRLRWRMIKTPMTESTARFWAANNNKVIERIDAPTTLPSTSRPETARAASSTAKIQ